MAASISSGADQSAPFTQPVCQNCQTSTTPLWRRDEAGSVLCNACGLFLKLHGRPRPISLKTDVIKSRNRVKTSSQGPKKKFEHNGGQPPQTDSLNGINPHRRVSQMAGSASDRSHSPISRTGTPTAHQDPNIAPQHLFDSVSAIVDPHYNNHNGSPADAALHPNPTQPSPSTAPMSDGQKHVEPLMSYDQLAALNTRLRTRVSELEVINMVYHDNEQNLCRERDRAIQEREEWKRKVEELQRRLQEVNNDDPRHIAKKPRLSQEPKE
ncbi:protein GZF3 [Cladophialophora bantiana CBS 173.52]|uniref:Protein GZF3 n=1 Tax=Cladophialophora bantiana (strain ATCC 10958 / CBS 173.52 / CDC B-1940 / NIH 8579) TaxID=1442370 RepID=A0A0D2HU71_CLAB1|nr:protein GZF3 [Cladophialophora bantiana CBS 173.52]KIW88029.1 protein GZF3 [Cladophialophora bantiana CBS 173.52]